MLIHIASYCKTTSLICLLEFYSWFKKFEKHYGRKRKVTSQAWQGSLFVITQETEQVKAFDHKKKPELRINRICSFIWQYIFGLAGIALSKFASHV